MPGLTGCHWSCHYHSEYLAARASTPASGSGGLTSYVQNDEVLDSRKTKRPVGRRRHSIG